MTNEVFNHVKHTPDEAYRVFFEALQSGSVQELVRSAYAFFGVPVLLTNEHYHLLALCPEVEIGLPLYDTLLNKKVLPKELVVSYQQEYLQETTVFYEPFYANTGLVTDCPRIFGEVYAEKKIYGHFAVMLSDEPFFDTDLACAGIFRDALKILMSRPKRGGFNSYSSYLLNLLENDTSRELRQFARDEIAKTTNSAYALMVTRIGPTALEQAFAAMSTTSLPGRYYEVISTIYDNYLVSLFGAVKGGDTYRASERQFFEKTAQSLSPAGKSGLSRPFTDLMKIPERFREAVLAWQTGDGTLSVFYEKMPGSLFCETAGQDDWPIFIHPVLSRIRAYDEENQSHYYETLKAYSLHLHSKEQTADHLHIHRNTLLYRLGRIAELFDLPIEDRNTALYLINSFQLLEAAEHRKKV